MKISIGTKMSAFAFTGIAMLIILSATAYWSLAKISEAAKLLPPLMPKMEKIDQLRFSLTETLKTNDFLVTGDLQKQNSFELSAMAVDEAIEAAKTEQWPHRQKTLLIKLEGQFATFKDKSHSISAVVQESGQDFLSPAVNEIVYEIDTIALSLVESSETLHDLLNEEISSVIRQGQNAETMGTRITITVSAIAILFVLSGAFLLSRNITKPIHTLTSVAESIAKGNLDERVHIGSHDEIGRLADVFNYMTEKIAQRNDELKQAQQQLQGHRDRLEEEVATRTADLTKARDEAQTANVAKSEFLANMSHEIRTPMNAVIGFSDVLAEEQLSEDQKNYVELIRNSAGDLLQIINDILDFSKIEAGKLETDINNCVLAALMDSVESMMRPEATKKQLDFQILQCGDLPVQIRTDDARLRQCLINLTNNAIKFTQQGHVYVNVSLVEIEGQSQIRFDVEDTGIGIPDEKQETIFDSFTQIDGADSRQFGGTGLGLTITKKLAGLLDGSLSVTSEKGKGSVFTLTIPANIPLESELSMDKYEYVNHVNQEKDIMSDQEFTGHVLVAEDSPTNQMLVKLLLERMGFEVTIVEDGCQAVQKALAGNFDLVLMDIQMPNMNGLEATRALRQKELDIPIIALTANAMKGDREKCLQAGCDGYLPKPIDVKQLAEIIQSHIPASCVAANETADTNNA